MPNQQLLINNLRGHAAPPQNVPQHPHPLSIKKDPRLTPTEDPDTGKHHLPMRMVRQHHARPADTALTGCTPG